MATMLGRPLVIDCTAIGSIFLTPIVSCQLTVVFNGTMPSTQHSAAANRSAQIDFGKRLRRLRRKRKLSTTTVGKKIGCSRQFVSDIERGLRSTSDVRVWIQLSDALGGDRVDIVTSAWRVRGSMALPAPERADAALKSLLDGLAPKVPSTKTGGRNAKRRS